MAMALQLVAQEMRQSDGSSATHKAFLLSLFLKNWAQGLKPGMNSAPMNSYNNNNKKTPRKLEKKHTSKTNPAFIEQEAGNHPHICHCRQGTRMSQEKPNCRYAAFNLSHPSCPSPAGMGVALSLLPRNSACRRGIQAGLCADDGKGREQAAL